MTNAPVTSQEAQKILPFHDGARFIHGEARTLGVILSPEICQLIAEHLLLPVDGKEVLVLILRIAQEKKQPLTADFVRQFLRELERKSDSYKPEAVLEAVAEYSGITVGELLSRDKHARVTHPRTMAMRLLSDMCKLSSTRIAKVLGGYDHTTVLAGFKRFKVLCELDPALLEDLEKVKKMVIRKSRLS